MKKLEEILNEIWYAKILSTNIDILRHTIKFNFKIFITNDETIDYNLTFSKVSSFYFLEGIGERRFLIPDYEPDNFYEFSSIGYYKDGLGKIEVKSDQDWAKQYYSNANFAVEFSRGMLFIEAEAIQINDDYFFVGFPK